MNDDPPTICKVIAYSNNHLVKYSLIQNASLTHRWQEYRAKAEAFYGIPVNSRPCTGHSSGKYNPMELQDAVTPPQFRRFPFYPDESPDVLLPIGYTGYTGNTYH